jgi:hypothetical protein
MSRNSAVLSRAGVDALPKRTEQLALGGTGRLGEYAHLIRQLFSIPSVVAIGGRGTSDGVKKVCEGVAAELASSGKRVVVVPVATVLRATPMEIPDESSFVPGRAPNILIWPPSAGREVDLLRFRQASEQENWMVALRHNFDAVLLECPALGTTEGVAEVMAMADATVLTVEAGRTSKQQIQHDQRALEVRGARLAGCILINRR